jgi:integrase
VRWLERARERSRSFDRFADARAFDAQVRTLKRTHGLEALDAGNETLAEFVGEWWELYAKPNLAPATRALYARMWNNHAHARLGERKLRELSPVMLVRFRAELERSGVGPEAARKTLSMLQGILQRAVEWERIPANPARAVQKPSAAPKRAVRPLTPGRVEALRRTLLGERRYRDATLISVLAYAGLRPQEALALEWRHVRDRTLLIEQALSDGRPQGPEDGTAASHGDVAPASAARPRRVATSPGAPGCSSARVSSRGGHALARA